MRGKVALVVGALLLPACGEESGAPVPGAFLALSPAQGAVGVFVGTDFDWQASADAASYTFELATDAGFTNVVVAAPGLTSTDYTPAVFLGGNLSYYWRVVAVNAAGSTTASGMPWTFSTGPPLPGAFLALSPAQNAVGVFVGTAFDWDVSADAASYTFELATDAGFSNVVVSASGLTSTDYTPSAPLAGNLGYHWRVIAVNVAGSTTASGMPWPFWTGDPLPGAFSVLSPTNGQTGVSLTPTFSWSPSSDSATYQVVVSVNADLSAPAVVQAGLTQTSFTHASEFAPATPYYWQVTAVNPVGTRVGTGAPWSFTTLSLTSPTWAGTLLGLTDTQPQYLVSVNPATGVLTRISGAGLEGHENVQGLAFDPGTGVFYGSDISTGLLLRIDPATGVPTAIGFMGYAGVYGLAFDAGRGILYGTDTETLSLLTLNTSTGLGTTVGPSGPFYLQGLAYRASGNQLYATDVSGDKLVRIDPLTGAGTEIGSLGGFYDINGLAYDPTLGYLYGSEWFTKRLFLVNPGSGGAVPIGTAANGTVGLDFDASGKLFGSTGRALHELNVSNGSSGPVRTMAFYDVRGLAYDPAGDRFFGVRMSFPSEVLSIHPVTGVGRSIGPTGLNADNHRLDCLAYDPGTGTLYGVDSRNGSLMTINVSTGAASVVGTPGIMGMSRVSGLEFDPSTSTLYGLDEYLNRLVTVNTATGGLTTVGALGMGWASGLALDPSSGILYGTNTMGDLFRIDKSTGRASKVGQVHLAITGLGWDSLRGRLVGTCSSSGWPTDALLAIDVLSARPTGIGSFGFTPSHSLAADPITGAVYGVWRKSNFVDQFLRINPVTGEATLIGEVAGNIEAMAFDTASRVLYAMDGEYDRLVRISVATGAVSVIGNSSSGIEALAIHPSSGVLYGIRQGVAPNQLVILNKSTGVATAIGGSAGLTGIQGIAFDANTGKLYGTNAYRELVEIDPATGASAVLGTSLRAMRDLLFR